ncbi:MAG: nitroreductase family protein [Parcubacteria group bacterium]|nr:nitroreductase family protein [Parcubacteria group bacterium]
MNTQKETALHIITEKEKKDMIADAVLDSMEEAMDDDDFRRELSQYVKNNLTSSPVGMPAFGMGIPTPLSFIAPFVLRKVNMARKSRKQDEDVLKTHTPAYIVISTREDAPAAWMNAGRAYERAALLSTKHGVSIAPMAAVIQIGDFYKRIQETLGISDRPQFFARIGYPEKVTAHSPRLHAENVIIQ